MYKCWVDGFRSMSTLLITSQHFQQKRFIYGHYWQIDFYHPPLELPSFFYNPPPLPPNQRVHDFFHSSPKSLTHHLLEIIMPPPKNRDGPPLISIASNLARQTLNQPVFKYFTHREVPAIGKPMVILLPHALNWQCWFTASCIKLTILIYLLILCHSCSFMDWHR